MEKRPSEGYEILKLEVRTEIKEGLKEKQKEAGISNLADYLRFVFTRLINGQIKL